MRIIGQHGLLAADVRTHLWKIADALNQMTNGLEKCGFKNDPLIDSGQWGTVSDCTGMCKNIATITNPVGIKNVLKDLFELFLASFKVGNGGTFKIFNSLINRIILFKFAQTFLRST